MQQFFGTEPPVTMLCLGSKNNNQIGPISRGGGGMESSEANNQVGSGHIKLIGSTAVSKPAAQQLQLNVWRNPHHVLQYAVATFHPTSPVGLAEPGNMSPASASKATVGPWANTVSWYYVAIHLPPQNLQAFVNRCLQSPVSPGAMPL